MNKQFRADLLLILATLFWGGSYYLMDLCLTDLPPLCLNAIRFIMAFALLGAVFNKSLRKLNRATVRYAIVIGLVLTATFIFYTYGIMYTTLSNAAFICALPVIVTPVIGAIFWKTSISRKQTVCIALCLVGLALLTLNDDLRPAPGDIICLGVPVCYAVDLLITEKAVQNPEVDALGLGVCQLGVVGAVALIASFILEKPHLPTRGDVWLAVLFLGVFCSGIAFLIQTTQQRYTTANHVGLIFTLEPVFATVFAFLMADERPSPRGIWGMSLMLVSLILMEIRLPRKK